MGTVAEPLKWDEPTRLELGRALRVELARRAAARKDVLTWGKMLFPEKFPLAPCRDLHEYMVEARGLPRVNTKAPRYHAKTTVQCFLIPIFQAIYEPDTFVHYLNVQATDKKANAVNLTIRAEIEENLELRMLVGDLEGDRWTDEQFVLANGVCFTAVSAGQSIRGIHYRNRRPDYIMVDDLYNESDIYNPEATEKKNEWFWSTLYPARAQGRRCSIHVQGTAVNELDLLHKLESSKDFASRTFRAVTDWEKKTVLWPEKNSFDDLMRDMGLMTSTIFMREMQNEPRDDASSIVRRGWIQEYDPADLVFNNEFQYVGTRLGVDPSIGQKSENDFTAIALIRCGRYPDSRGTFYYIEALWNEHWTLDQRVRELQGIQDRQPPNRKIDVAYIEAIAGFKDFCAEVKRRTTLPVREIDHVQDKLATLESKAWFFETGHVLINKHIAHDLKANWIYQMTTNHPQYDDMRDATLLPLEMLKADAWAWAD